MNKNLATISLEEQQSLLDEMKKFQFFKDGYVDGYYFAYGLAQSLWLDGLELEYARKLVDLMLSFVDEQQIKSKIVFEAPIDDISLEAKRVYPEGQTVLFHCTYFLNIHQIISAIGDEVLNIPRTDEKLYSWWIKQEYIYTCAYFDTFFREFTKLLNSTKGYQSLIVNLQLSRHISDEDFSAYSTLVNKEERFEEIKKRINVALNQNFNLEAIALQESCLSDRLSLVMYIKGKKAGTKSFAKLIQQSRDFMPIELNNDIDSWRNARNKSIHNLVRSSPLDELVELDKLDELSSVTAKDGVKLLAKVDNWFKEFVLYELNPFNFRPPEKTNAIIS
ncbi:hypothetical protein Q4557_19310 [Shewanella sp. 5_MG-2023]|uniref:hypothetical protein n=1 Tax=Shewanella sp. 5_MG-2023 TaxID=3062656 RepID=UPI0026E39B34|nr:hypothetical protein [Shewanella sp. 5_MG-2023]MDO6642104.1 hypothetical protein [Shewanella sp. 5_MG-2023]